MDCVFEGMNFGLRRLAAVLAPVGMRIDIVARAVPLAADPLDTGAGAAPAFDGGTLPPPPPPPPAHAAKIAIAAKAATVRFLINAFRFRVAAPVGCHGL
jgi:hypothetical protein